MLFKKIPVNSITCYREKGMKNDWCIVLSKEEIITNQPIQYYSKHWSIERSFRDIRIIDLVLGCTRACDSQDRLLLLRVIAVALLTLLGVAGEAIDFD
jgi:hypothetical protein